jgi:nucleoside-diphosphate-sugar epimerase
MVFENATKYPTPEDYVKDTPIPTSAYGFSKLTGEVYCRAAHDEFGLPFTICRPFNAYGPGEMPEDEPGIAHMVPDVIKKVLAAAAAADLRRRHADPDDHPHRRHRRRHRRRDGLAEGPQRGLQHLGRRGDDRRRDLPVIWEACGEDPAELEFEHLPTFEVDVVRRWPDVSKAERLLGWKARIGAREGIEATVAWLRDTLPLNR